MNAVSLLSFFVVVVFCLIQTDSPSRKRRRLSPDSDFLQPNALKHEMIVDGSQTALRYKLPLSTQAHQRTAITATEPGVRNRRKSVIRRFLNIQCAFVELICFNPIQIPLAIGASFLPHFRSWLLILDLGPQMSYYFSMLKNILDGL